MTILDGVDAGNQSAFESSAQISVQAPASASSSSSQPVSFVTAEQFEAINDKWSEQFTRFEALFSRGNVFTIPKTVVCSLPFHTVVSAQPFINPAARYTGPVVSLAVQEELYKKVKLNQKRKSKSPQRRTRLFRTLCLIILLKTSPVREMMTCRNRYFSLFRLLLLHPGSKFTGSEEAFTDSASKTTSSSSLFTEGPIYTGQEATCTSQGERAPYPLAALISSAVCTSPPYGFSDAVYRDLPLQDVSDNKLSGDEDSVAEEGEVSSDVIDRQDQTEDMTHRETVRSVHSFMGWNHIRVYESDLSEPDKSNNPWKGRNPKKPARISVAMPPPPPPYGFSDAVYRDLPLQDVSDNKLSGDEDSVAEEGEVSSDVIDRQDQTEDMTHRETVRSVHSFMGWNHIRVYESDLSEPDKSNNPWKGRNPKKPARISVAMPPPPPPPDDWLCQKLEKLNTTIAEGYPSRAQDSAEIQSSSRFRIFKASGIRCIPLNQMAHIDLAKICSAGVTL